MPRSGCPLHPARTVGSQERRAGDKHLPYDLLWGDSSGFLARLPVTIGQALNSAVISLRMVIPPGDLSHQEIHLEAEVLLAHVLDLNRAQLLTYPDRRLDDSEIDRFQALLRRRLAGEPMAYLLGEREFYGLTFAVDRRVLIPRPETEHLVDHAIAFARDLQSQSPLIADIGTGSGAIAVALARYLPSATVYATDVDSAALEVAAINIRRHAVSDRVHLLHGDLLSPVPVPVDLIVANLPYIAPARYVALRPTVRCFEPPRALLAEENGLALYRRLISDVRPYLRPGAALILEIDPAQAAAMAILARRHLNDVAISVFADYAGLTRVAVLRTHP